MSRHKKQSHSRPSKAALENRAEQLNPDSPKFWKARGYPARPADWKTTVPRPRTPPAKKPS